MTPRWSRLVREHPWDIGLSLAALLVMLPTCSYRYGLDQSLYHYVGRGWLHGMLPYRDSFDIKPPAIYALYALLNLCFGESQHPIRIAEIACVLALGFVTAAAVTPEKRSDDPDGHGGADAPDGPRAVDGLAGTSALLLGAFYVTLFGFWDTGQVELWEAACLVGSFALVNARSGPSTRRLLGAGALASAAVLFKITAAIPAVGLGAFCVMRGLNAHSRRVSSAFRSLSVFAVGAVAPLAVTASYFAVHGAFSSLREWFLYVPYYAREPLDSEWVASVGPELLLARCGFWFGVFAVPCLVGLSEARRSRVALALDPAVWATLLLATGVASIVVQRRYFSYHPVVLGPLLVLAAAPGVRVFLLHRRAVMVGSVFFLVLGSVLGAPAWTSDDAVAGSYRDFVLHAFWPRITGNLSDRAFAAVFVGPFGYSYAEEESVAALITAQKPRPSDRLHVRGYATTIYVLSGLHSPSRFMMEGPVRDSYLASYEPEWATEHARILLEERRPRFFVTNVGTQDDIELIENAGYGKVGSRGRFLLLELGLGSVPLHDDQLGAMVAGHSFRGTALGGLELSATFDVDGHLDADLQGEDRRGEWRISENRLCVKWSGSGERCASVYDRGAHYVAFDETSQELADLRPSEVAP